MKPQNPTPYGCYSFDYAAHERGDGRWEVVQHNHCIDRRGEKDTITDPLSTWATEAEALAELGRIRGVEHA